MKTEQEIKEAIALFGLASISAREKGDELAADLLFKGRETLQWVLGIETEPKNLIQEGLQYLSERYKENMPLAKFNEYVERSLTL